MDNGESSYRRFLEGDDSGFIEIIRDYKDGLILFLHSMTRDYGLAEELCEDTFVRLAQALFAPTLCRHLTSALPFLRKQ